MEFHALKKRSLVQMVEDQILTHIITGELRSGDFLPVEAQLAKSFEIGKSTIREALRTLESKGTIQIIPRKGICVRNVPETLLKEGGIELNLNLGPGHLPELLETQTSLLASCAWLACQNRTMLDLQNLRKVIGGIGVSIDQLKRTKHPGNIHKKYEAQYLDYYGILSRATHNTLFIKLVDAVHTNISRNLPLARMFFVRDVEEAQMLLNLDQQLVDVMDDQDCGRALMLGVKKAQEIARIISRSLKL
jgi:GntR family transcriptional regulator, transcriptional repressor for pyruvate dehydrogenase complex